MPNSSVSDDDLSVFQFWAEKVAEKMSEEGKPYHGILYMGLMKDREKGWVLIEFNSRFGDPETQALVLSWAREKRVLRNALALDLKQGERVFSDDEKAVVCLALVRPEYPGKAPSNFELADWMVEQEDCQLFRSQSIGGRVAYLVAEGSDRSKACERIFQELLNSPWKEKLEWRPDIIA